MDQLDPSYCLIHHPSIPSGEHENRCLEEREQANRASAESGIPIFIPVCRDDGTYVEVSE